MLAVRLSVATKIFLAFAVALGAFGLASVVGISRLHHLRQELKVLSEGYLPLTRIAAELEVKEWFSSRVLELKAADRRPYLPVARAHFPGVIREKIAEGREVVARARSIATGADVAFLDDIGQRLEALSGRWAQYDAASKALFQALDAAKPDPAELEQRAQVVRTLEKGLSLDAKLLSVRLEGQIADKVQGTERIEARTVLAIIVYSLLAIVVGLGAAMISQRLLLPIRTLTEGVKAVASGDLTRKVDVRSGDEIGILAHEFNTMAASLDHQREQLLRAERLAAIGRISAQITHEIRNPLNSIGLNAELLGDELRETGGPRSTEIRQLVDAISREVDRLSGVTEEYLRFAKLPKPALAREDLNEVLGDLLDFLGPELSEARVTLSRELAPSLPQVQADAAQLRAAFLNLLRNSREAMADGGQVVVRTRLVGDGVEAEVSDTGGGIPAEALSRIFDPFYSTKERGTGLGLAFTQQVVQEHGGTIRCDSQPGRGTTFTVKLPLAPEERASPTAPAPKAANG
jgi:signal transduction histidine kinase